MPALGAHRAAAARDDVGGHHPGTDGDGDVRAGVHDNPDELVTENDPFLEPRHLSLHQAEVGATYRRRRHPKDGVGRLEQLRPRPFLHPNLPLTGVGHSFHGFPP